MFAAIQKLNFVIPKKFKIRIFTILVTDQDGVAHPGGPARPHLLEEPARHWNHLRIRPRCPSRRQIRLRDLRLGEPGPGPDHGYDGIPDLQERSRSG